MKTLSLKTILLLFLVTLAIRFVGIYFFPLTQDEAYYFYWSNFLDLGYFDHPPFVAWMSSLGQFMPETVWLSRLGGCILTLTMFPVMLSLAKLWGLVERNQLLVCIILSQLSLGGILLGIIQTPDLPLAVFWLLAIHEAAVALKQDPKRWISAGIMTGFGLMSKYTMAVMGFVFLYALLRKHRGLRSPWPYLGGLACVITFLPHLMWNFNNDWVTFRFQFGRGLKSEYNVDTKLGNTLPPAIEAQVGSREEILARSFIRPEEKKKPKKTLSSFEKSMKRVSNFIGGQLGLWGLLIFPIGYLLWRQRKPFNKTGLDENISHLLVGSVIVPLGVFGALSPFQNIEANWPAVYLLGASLLLAARISNWRPLLWAGFANLSLFTLLTIHAHSPLQDKKPHKDRVLYETRGYESLSTYLEELNIPLFADTYQNTSMIAFYNSDRPITQWPGITRPSEMIRREQMMKTSFEDVLKEESFYLITNNRIPPSIPQFTISSLKEVRDCVSGELQVFDANEGNYLKDSCPKAVHRWSLAHYLLSGSSSETSM